MGALATPRLHKASELVITCSTSLPFRAITRLKYSVIVRLFCFLWNRHLHSLCGKQINNFTYFHSLYSKASTPLAFQYHVYTLADEIAQWTCTLLCAAGLQRLFSPKRTLTGCYSNLLRKVHFLLGSPVFYHLTQNACSAPEHLECDSMEVASTHLALNTRRTTMRIKTQWILNKRQHCNYNAAAIALRRWGG